MKSWHMLWLALLSLPNIAMAALQNNFLYFPDRLPADRYAAEAAAAGLAPWPSRTDFRALLSEPAGPVRATTIVFHGNAGLALGRSWYATQLTGLGLRTILVEYPGYGHRQGPLGETNLVADGAELVALARRQFGGAIIIVGESLGAGVAGAVAARTPPDAVLLITPWKNLADVADHHYRWLPTRWLLRDRYDTAANLAGFKGPLAVVVAAQDQIIPSQFGKALFNALPAAAKRLYLLKGVGHNDWYQAVDAAWWRQLTDFLMSE